MAISEHTEGTVTVLQIHGRLEGSSAPETEARIVASIEAGARQMVLDLAAIEYISSAGLRVLLTAAKRMQQAKGKLVLAAASPQTLEVLEMTGFATIVPLFPTTAAACAAVAATPAPAPAKPCELTFAEEIFLLALDDQTGVVKPMPVFALDYALAGALLMELALRDRVDTDLTRLKVTSTAATGDPLLDETLHELRQEPEPRSTAFWLQQLSEPSKGIAGKVLASLVGKGVLKQEDRRILWVFAVRRYPMIDNREIKEVRARLRDIILGSDIPDPRDIVLISLGNACQLIDDLFTAQERDQVQPRVAALARLDLIGREMAEAINEIKQTMAMAMTVI